MIHSLPHSFTHSLTHSLLSLIHSLTHISSGMVWYGMGMMWYGMVWYGMVWYGMVWYGWYGIRDLILEFLMFLSHLSLISANLWNEAAKHLV